MAGAPRKIAFVSGKGGVGKTLVAANFVFCASTVQRSILIDLDFQNQGASGLLASYLEPGCLNAFDLLTAADETQTKSPVEVRKNLFFVPAFDPRKADRFGSQIVSPLGSISAATVDGALESMLVSRHFDLVVIDCHGGLDDVSFGAFISADMTFVVTEADKVTFNGTLELLDFYIARADAANLAGRPSYVSSHADSLATRISHVEDNKIKFVINRTSSKFSYRALKNTLIRQFYANIEILQKMNEGLIFIPADPLLGESFSEYPFYLELMPESIFSQKIDMMYSDLFEKKPNITGRSWFYKRFERIKRPKLERLLSSAYDSRVQAVLSFVAVSQLIFLFAILGLMIWLVSSAIVKPAEFGLVSSFLFALFCLYLARFNFQVNGFFRDRMRYELRLYRRGARNLSIIFAMRLVRLLMFRAVLSTSAVFYFLMGAGYIVAALIGIIRLVAL